MDWSIAEVARMSKVTSRTLRHYDDIGLLPPARVGGNGYRYYEQEQLLRLQRILLLRQLGLSLDAIGGILNAGHDEVAELRRHRRWLLTERDRLGRLAETVEHTIAQYEGDWNMKAEELFEGFDAQRQARYEEELVERYGEGVKESIAESKRRVQSMTKEQAQDIQRQIGEIGARVVAQIEARAAPDDPSTLDVIEDHYRWVSNFWTPNRESYTGLGQLYVDSADFKAMYDAQHPALAEYLRDAIAAYANLRL